MFVSKMGSGRGARRCLSTSGTLDGARASSELVRGCFLCDLGSHLGVGFGQVLGDSGVFFCDRVFFYEFR